MKIPTPMIISLKDNAKPLKVLAARQVPRRYEEPAEDIIQDLINKGVLARVSDVTDWCSPGFFVPKSDGRVRIVNRPVHPFPSTRDILQAIPHDTVYFLQMDAVHGYFQLALSEDSSLLTTFLLQHGKFRYLRAPMGLNASSDKWCCHSDRIVTGLPWAKKIVDDTIIWAPTLEELQERATIILERCRDLNITISLKKLEHGKEITFTGHIISQAGISSHRVSNANQRLSAEIIHRPGKSAHGIRPGLGSYDSSTPATTEKGDHLGLDRGHGKGV